MRHLRPLCSHCVYWIADKTANPPTAGHCHRFPPGIYVNPQTGTVIQKFPTTDHHHWCGEWNGDDAKLVGAAQSLAVKSAEKL